MSESQYRWMVRRGYSSLELSTSRTRTDLRCSLDTRYSSYIPASPADTRYSSYTPASPADTRYSSYTPASAADTRYSSYIPASPADCHVRV